MGQKDLPAVIDHIRWVTRQSELSYIGHSQGTLQAFILLSEKPEYSQILKPIIMLAPVVDVTTIKDQARMLIENDELAKDLKKIGGPVFPHASLLELLPEVICSKKVHYICENVVALFGGMNLPQLNITRLPVYFSYVPAGTSATNVLHYHQAIKNGTRYYDHGEEINKLLYGTENPPKIPWEKINSPYIAIFYGENDLFAGPEEVSNAKKLIKSKLIVQIKTENSEALFYFLKAPFWFEYKVPDHLWSHMDFLWGKQAGEFVYSHILSMLKKFPIRYMNPRYGK